MDQPPSLHEINSERPLDIFANFYANGDSCREAVIMQMNRDANEQGQTYLRSLFKAMEEQNINSKHELATILWSLRDHDPAVREFLLGNDCIL